MRELPPRMDRAERRGRTFELPEVWEREDRQAVR